MKLPEADDIRQALAMALGTSVNDYCPNCARPLDDLGAPHDVAACGEEIQKLHDMLDKGITLSYSDGTTEVLDNTNTRIT